MHCQHRKCRNPYRSSRGANGISACRSAISHFRHLAASHAEYRNEPHYTLLHDFSTSDCANLLSAADAARAQMRENDECYGQRRRRCRPRSIGAGAEFAVGSPSPPGATSPRPSCLQLRAPQCCGARSALHAASAADPRPAVAAATSTAAAADASAAAAEEAATAAAAASAAPARAIKEDQQHQLPLHFALAAIAQKMDALYFAAAALWADSGFVGTRAPAGPQLQRSSPIAMSS